MRVMPDVPSFIFIKQHPLLLICLIHFLYFTRTSPFYSALSLLIFTPYLIPFHFVPFVFLYSLCHLHPPLFSHIINLFRFLHTIFFLFSPPHFLPSFFSSSPSLHCQCSSILFSSPVHSLSAQSAQNIKRNSGFLLLKSHSLSIIS